MLYLLLAFIFGIFLGIIIMRFGFYCGEIHIDTETHDRDIYRLEMHRLPRRKYALFKNVFEKLDNDISIPQDFHDS